MAYAKRTTIVSDTDLQLPDPCPFPDCTIVNRYVTYLLSPRAKISKYVFKLPALTDILYNGRL